MGCGNKNIANKLSLGLEINTKSIKLFLTQKVLMGLEAKH